MSSSKRNRKWKNKVLEDLLKLTEGSILKFQDQITSVNNPNDVPLRRERIFEKTVFRISHIDKEDCKPLPKKEVKLKNSDVLLDQSELIAEIDKNIKNLKDQKKFLKMERESHKTWGEHLSRNQYANNCNRRCIPAVHCRRGCDEHVCEFLEKFICRTPVKVVDSSTQIESPCPKWVCDRADYVSPQCVDNMENNGNMYCCRTYNFGQNVHLTSDCSSVDVEWKARKNNCNFREMPAKKVDSSSQVGYCKKCPKPQCFNQKRASLCSPASLASSPRCGMSPCEGVDFLTRSGPDSRSRAQKRSDCCSDESQDKFKTTYMASYGNFASNNRVSCLDKELKTKIFNSNSPRKYPAFLLDENCPRKNIKSRNLCFSPDTQSPRTPRKTSAKSPRNDSVERDLRRMPYRPVKLSDEIEQRRWGTRQKSPAPKPFNQQSYSPRSPRKAGTYTHVSPHRATDSASAGYKKSPRPKTKTQLKNARSYSQVSPRSPRIVKTYTQVNRQRASYSPRYKQSSRQTSKTPEQKNAQSYKQVSPRSPRKVEPSRQVSRTAGLEPTGYRQSSYERTSALDPRNARSERSQYSKTIKSRQVIQSKPLTTSSKESPTQIHEIYEKSTKVKQFRYKTHRTYRHTPPLSYEALDHEDEIEFSSQQAFKTSSRSPTNDLSEASSSTPLRKHNIVKPNVVDDNTYLRPDNDQSKDYVILPYSPLPKEEEETPGRRLSQLEPEAYPTKLPEKLSPSVIKKSEVILEDASNVSIEQMKDMSFKPSQEFKVKNAYMIQEPEVCHICKVQVNESISPQPHQVEEVYYKSESKHEPQMNASTTTQIETKQEFYISESSRELNVTETPQFKSLTGPQHETKEVFLKSESNRQVNEMPHTAGAIEIPQTKPSESNHQVNQISLQTKALTDETKEVVFKTESNRQVNDKSRKLESNSEIPQLKTYTAQTKEELLNSESTPEPQTMSFKQEITPAPSTSLSISPPQYTVNIKSEPSQIKTPASLRPEVEDTSLDIKPFLSEISHSTSYVKEDRPFKSDPELKSYSKISEDMSKRSQSSKILSNEDNVRNVPPTEEQTYTKSEVDSQMSDASQEGVFLSETINPIDPIKGIDSELQNFIQYLQNRLRDCDEMVRKQIQKFDLDRKDVCQKVCKVEQQTSCDESDRSFDQTRVRQRFKGSQLKSQPTCKGDNRGKQKDISCHSSAKSGAGDKCHSMKEEIGELILPFNSDQISESEMEYETDCHCYLCEEDQLSPVGSDIPPFDGCDCMKEDYYKIMRLVYNK